MPTLTNIEEKVLGLSGKERIDLVLKLLESLEAKTNSGDVMDKWVEEAETRYQAWKRGDVKTISEEEVSSRVQQHLEE